MKEYTYYPGCSLEESAQCYDTSTIAVAEKLGLKLIELEDWNCCGATSYMSIDEKMAFCLSARNLALAEPLGRDLVTPCSGCFTTLNKTNHYYHDYPEVKNMITDVLSKGNLEYGGSINVRHILDIMVNDSEKDVAALVEKPLTGLKIACYYGCQLVRPKGAFDDPEDPTTLDVLMTQLGGEAVKFQFKAKCCGGSLMGTKEDLALRMSKNILMSAAENGANAIVTICPLCQIILDSFQNKVNQKYDTKFKIPIFFFTQLMGYAFGVPKAELKLDSGVVPMEPVLAGI